MKRIFVFIFVSIFLVTGCGPVIYAVRQNKLKKRQTAMQMKFEKFDHPEKALETNKGESPFFTQ